MFLRHGFRYTNVALQPSSATPFVLTTLPIYFNVAALVAAGGLKQERTGASATTTSNVGDVVGSILNQGTFGGWAVAPSDAARGILRQSGAVYYIEFDGVDDKYQLDFSNQTPVVVQAFVAAYYTSATDQFGQLMPFTNGGNQPYNGTNRVAIGSRNNSTTTWDVEANSTRLVSVTVTQDADFVYQGRADGANRYARVDKGTAATSSAGSSLSFSLDKIWLMSSLSGMVFTGGRLYGACAAMQAAALGSTDEDSIISQLAALQGRSI